MPKTTINYSGRVTVQTADRKVKRHNSGTVNLFYLISGLLGRTMVTQEKLPSYLMIYDYSDKKTLLSTPWATKHTTFAVLPTYVPIVGSIVQDDDKNYGVRFECLIEPEHTKSMNASNVSKKVCVALVGGDKDSIVAVAMIDGFDGVIASLTNRNSVKISWDMNFTEGDEANGSKTD